MTDMRRWQASINYLYPVDKTTPLHPGRMEVYLASDAEAAIAAAEQHAIKCAEIADRHGYERGQRDMLAKCIAAVEAWALENPYEYPSPNRIIADLRALEDD